MILLQSALLASTVLAGQASADVIATSGTVFLNADPGHSISYELKGATTWQHGVDGSLYGNDNVSRADEGVNLFFARNDSERWLLQFVAPRYDPVDGSMDGQALRTGRYDNVRGDWRFEPMQAGMLISSPLGMTWDWSGWFEVLDIAYADNGDLSRFAVDFVQYDTLDQTGPALRGSLRYQLAPVAIPETGTLALVGLGLALLAMSARRRRQEVNPAN
jgi:hypothetical protein